MPKPKTQAQIDRTTDARLLKKYGVGLDWYNTQLEKQGGVCAITGQPPGTRRLHVDHDHSWTKIEVSTDSRGMFTGDKKWAAYAEYCGGEFYGFGRTKSVAQRQVKALLKRASVRGLLTYRANVGLEKFSDNAVWLRAAAKYLEDHQGVK